MTARACPCGTGRDFDDCCRPFLDGDALPATPEQLMRSRYTAFVRADDVYLLATWHPGTAPEDVDPVPGLDWIGLEVIDAPPVEPGAKRGVVEFAAHWREHRDRGTLHERSRFVLQSGRWWYLDGVVDPPRG